MFSRIFIERPRLAMVVSLVMVIAGIISVRSLPVAEYPEIAPPTVSISATYAGASADVVAQTVATPIEDEINSVEGVLYFSSTCSNSGSYSCSVTFRSGTDTDMAMVNLQNAIKRAEAKLPSDVIKTGVRVEKRGGDMLAVFAFLTDGKTLDLMQLNDYVNSNVKDAVARLEGVSSASVMSSNEYAMRIWLDPYRMSGLAISTADIMNAVSKQNIQAAAGSIGNENSNLYINYKINVEGRLKNAEEFENIILRSDSTDGSVVRLKDVARVEVGSSTYAGKSVFNGKQVVGLSIYRSPEANALSTMNRIKAELEKIKPRLPEGVSYDTAFDPTKFISVSLNEIIVTIITALLLVVIITWIFIQDWRATLIPAVAIPVALLGTFPFMMIFGYSINVLTMFGLILVIGSLCDDAIVVVENTQSLMEREGLSPKEAALKCMEQITGAIIATTLVTVACYAPLAFYGGMVGEIYLQFAVTMCISLCLSTVVAMTLSPAMCALILRKSDGKVNKFFLPFNKALDFSSGIYLRCTGFLARRMILTLILLIGCGTALWFLFNRIDSSFLPDEDKGVIMCNIELPPGASLARTEAVLDRFENAVKDLPGVQSVMMVSGMSMMSGSGENTAMVILSLKNWSERKSAKTQIENIIKAANLRTADIADARIIFFTPPAIMGLGSTGGASFQLCGSGNVDAAELSELTAKTTRELMAHRDKIQFANSSYNANNTQLHLDVDRRKAETMGVPVSNIYSTLQSKLASLYINDFTMNGKNYKVKMQSPARYRATINDIRDIQVKNNDGEMVPLSSVAKIRFVTGPMQISRFNKMTSADMTVRTQPGHSSQEVFDLVEDLKLPKNFQVEWTGLSYQEKQNQGQIVYLMALALLFAYLFLVAQYESWMIPIPVMLSVTFAVLGAQLGLLLTGSTLSIYAQLGMVMLIGLAAKNAILMVEFSKTERESGKSVIDAALSGAKLRYRAVLMTAWSFLFGVFPMVIATGAGAGSRQAIGITTFSGMLLATLIGIVFTPALYAAFQRITEWVCRKKSVKQAP